MPLVLVAEDEEPQRKMIASYLNKMGFETLEAENGEQVLDLLKRSSPDVLLLDLMMPKLDGFEVLKALLHERLLPTIVISARGEEADKIVGLELGADDYMTKPFSLREMTARIQGLLRRAKLTAGPQPILGKKVWKDLEIDLAGHKVRKNGQLLALTAVQFQILEFLLNPAGQVFSRMQILEGVLHTSVDTYERTVDAHIKNLRKALGEDPQCPTYIETIRGVGYLAILDKS